MELRSITNPNNALDMINKIIVIQVFKKDQNPDNLVSESLRKYVGTLRAYWITANFLCFAIDGIPHIYIDRHKEYHELWVPWNTAEDFR